MDVSENKLKAIPDGLCSLAALESLDISENEITALPAEFGQLTNLETLMCFKNLLSKLPDSIGKCAALSEVNLFNNKLIRLPAAMSDLNGLTDLNVGGNKLKTLPKTDNWTQLETLKCHQNTLIMLPSFGQMGALVTLKMDMCKALRELPDFGDNGLPLLETLEISSCDLQLLPASLSKMRSLKSLYCQSNSIASFDASMAPSLELLNASNNDGLRSLSDSSIAACAPSLRVLFLQGTGLTEASMPAALTSCSLPKLARLMVPPQSLSDDTLTALKNVTEGNGGWTKEV